LEISKESKVNPALFNKLSTHHSREVIEKFRPKKFNFRSILLSADPTAQEINILEYFYKLENKPISRDDLAKILWGKSWQEKYSDWAMDKAISRLRKKMKGSEFKIITVKNLGYKFLKMS